MPNWCSCNLEVESKDFIQSLNESLNYDKIANILFLIIKMPALGYEKEKPYAVIQEFSTKVANLENMEKLESIFNSMYPTEILDNDAALQTILDSSTNSPMFLGRTPKPKDIRDSIRSENIIKHEKPEFSLFNYTNRAMGLFLSEYFQFSLSQEETDALQVDVLDTNRQDLGTKWDVSDCCIDINDNIVNISFNTAWSPPIPVIERIAERYQESTIQLVFAEMGAAYCGQLEFENGEETVCLDSSFTFQFDEDEDEDEDSEEPDFNDLANWNYDEDIELKKLNGRFGG